MLIRASQLSSQKGPRAAAKAAWVPILLVLPESQGTPGTYGIPPSLTLLPCDVVTITPPRCQGHGEECACRHLPKYPCASICVPSAFLPEGSLQLWGGVSETTWEGPARGRSANTALIPLPVSQRLNWDNISEKKSHQLGNPIHTRARENGVQGWSGCPATSQRKSLGSWALRSSTTS